MGEWVSERDLATIGLKIKDSPETTSSTELAHPREIGLTTSVIQLKQLTGNSDLGVTTATATHDNDDRTNKKSTSQQQTFLVKTSATTSTEQVSETQKQKTKRHTASYR